MTGDPYWSNVVFLSGFEGGSIVDESPLAQTVTVAGSAAQSSTQAKFGTKSLFRSVADVDGISVPDNAAFFDGNDSWTVEMWVWWDTFANGNFEPLAGQWSGGTTITWMLQYLHGSPGRIRLFLYDGTTRIISVNWTPSLGGFYHIAADYDGTSFRIYVDGSCISTTTVLALVGAGTINLTNSDAPLAVGCNYGDNASAFGGYIDEVRITAGVARYATDTSFTVPSAAFDRFGEDPLDVEMVEGVAFTAFSGLGDVFEAVLAEGVGVSTLSIAGYPASISELLSILPTLAVIRRQPATISENVGLAPAMLPLRGIVLLETIGIALSQATNQHSNLALLEGIGIDETFLTARPVIVAENVGLAMTQQALLVVNVIEHLGLLPTMAAMLKMGQTVTERFYLADALDKFFTANVSEMIGLAPMFTVIGSLAGRVSEVVGLQETMTPKLLLRATINDSLGLDDASILKMIFSGKIMEGLEIVGAYVAPDGGFTTWAMNTRTGAVTEYQNYAFNSFAQIGDVYFGATSDGLYKLTGTTDDGAAIIADLKSGLMQWSGTKFSMFKGIYLGVRGGGDFVLKLTTGDGKDYHYSVNAKDMATTKITTGKGLRARYWAFELISAGQDFDLDTIEFVPVTSDRRV